MIELRQPVGAMTGQKKGIHKPDYNTNDLSPSLGRVMNQLRNQPSTVEQIKRQAYVADPRQMIWLLRAKGYPIKTTFVELNDDYRHKYALYSLGGES